MTRILIATIALVTLGACSAGDAPAEDAAAEQAAVMTGVTVSDAYIMPPFAGRDVAGGFMTLSNDGADDRLIAVSSPIAETVEMHTHSEVDGVMAMRQVDGIDIPSGGSVELRPGSYHLMMFGVTLDEAATSAPVTLTYESGQEETLDVPIER